MTRNEALSAIMFAACLAASSHSFATACTTGVVTAVSIGDHDVDGGNIIEVQISSTGNKWWVANNARNLNDAPGYALLHLLTLSKVTGTNVTIGDDKGTRCDDFNSVLLR